uniref:C2H2-type domain-containing protein n=1 Tax=Salarias fasciatus TaxID=181472 RepID=A0A672GLY4_SALFA
MLSFRDLRGLLSARLSAAAADICSLLETHTHPAGFPQQHVCREDEEQEEGQAPQVKEEQEEVCVGPDARELLVRQGRRLCVRQLISDRLTANLRDVFSQWEQLEEEQRLMEAFWKPRVLLHRAELPQQRVCKEEEEEEEEEEEALSEQHWSSSLDPEEPEPVQTRGERGQELDGGQTRREEHLAAAGWRGSVPEVDEVSPSPERGGRSPGRRDVCGKGFGSAARLRIHAATHTGAKPYPCHTCGKRFSQQGNLTIHLRTHTGERPYLCGTCGKRFSQQGNLTVHLRTHTGERPYLCGTCGRGFIYPTHLKSHMRIHMDLKQYSCEQCGTSFRHKVTLSRHMKVHSGQSRHHCGACGRFFRDGYTLALHVRTHTGEKPHRCGACGRRFARLTHLQAHEARHGGEKPYCCAACGRSFFEKSSVLNHMRSHCGNRGDEDGGDVLSREEDEGDVLSR